MCYFIIFLLICFAMFRLEESARRILDEGNREMTQAYTLRHLAKEQEKFYESLLKARLVRTCE